MPRKSITMSEPQHDLLRRHKLEYQAAQNIPTLGDLAYLMACSELVNKSLKIKRK
jgi:hypothetical protein